MKDWMNQYQGTRKYQAGGAMPPPQGGQGGAPDIEAMLAEYAQTRDPQLAVAICDMLVEMAMGGPGGGAPGGAPAGPPPGPPMAKKGAKLSRGPVFKL